MFYGPFISPRLGPRLLGDFKPNSDRIAVTPGMVVTMRICAPKKLISKSFQQLYTKYKPSTNNIETLFTTLS